MWVSNQVNSFEIHNFILLYVWQHLSWKKKTFSKVVKKEEWRKWLFNMFFGGLKDLTVDTKLMWLSHLVFTLLHTVNCQQNGQTKHGTMESELEHHLSLYCSLYCFTGSKTLVCYNNMHTHCHTLSNFCMKSLS